MNNDLKIGVVQRKATKKVLVHHHANPLYIGGDSPISVQSMTTTDTSDYESTIQQINDLANAGCQLVRLAVENNDQLDNVAKLVQASTVPLVADIQFDYRLAIACCDLGCAKIRFNPGNVGGIAKVKEIATAAKRNGTIIRVGANSGSVEKKFLNDANGNHAVALCNSAVSSVRVLEDCGFDNIVVSLKCSNATLNLFANRLLSNIIDYPLHIGVTESGVPKSGLPKSFAGLGALLVDGIGDTMRISLTADPVQEVTAGIDLLKALDLRQCVEVVSCPTCSRCKYDMIDLANRVQNKVENLANPLKIAVMGCVVNGPGEAKHADLGIAGGDGKAVVFEKGEVIYTASDVDAEKYFLEKLDKLIK
ncbi:MAG: flavodoxin-dependent (E)-4-hydroxy-3-methylbut-2-enyl-diphosphate synthase [Firmicutes bacterium]|nr:flavodoxin-dependent (E)-4-hydroxy-3-methylbut-2-enyl-diphosphate synthase [Bacillota bacterium]MCL1953908.1 flavodoxin-dependent (E)-4-hydroxy-3-methylbut-2-enyl-diphosphate synthase [Bacillota bacterium]